MSEKLNNWKDVTTYRRDEKDREPRVLQVVISGIRLVLVWNHLYVPNEWCFHFGDIFNQIGLGFKKYDDIEEAKKSALKTIQIFLESGVLEIKDLLNEN